MCCFLILNLILIIIEPVPEDNRIWWVLGFVLFPFMKCRQRTERVWTKFITQNSFLICYAAEVFQEQEGKQIQMSKVRNEQSQALIDFQIQTTIILIFSPPCVGLAMISSQFYSLLTPHSLILFWCLMLQLKKGQHTKPLWRLEHIHRGMWRSTWRGEKFSSMAFPWKKEAKFLSSKSR